MHHLKGFVNSRLNKLLVENEREMICFIETACAHAGADHGVEDCDELAIILTEQVQQRFSPLLHVVARDAMGQRADENSPAIFMVVEPTQKIIRH